MKLFRLATFASVLSAFAISAEAAKKPNILFVLTDDQAAWALGASGNPQAITPNMDRLANEGAYLPNSYVVTPVCSPSRASLMTSRYGSEVGITDWIHPRNEPNHGLPNNLPVWPRYLQRAGYVTGLVGKWHLGLLDSQHPTKRGFDHFMGHRAGGWPTANPTLEKDGENQKFQGLTADILADHAIAFLEAHKDDTFLLAWHTRAPHTRWLPVSDEDMEPLKDLELEIPNPNYPDLDVQRVTRMMREYLASVRSVDRNLGRVLKTLDDLGIADNTVVIFTADHGYSMGHNGIWHKGNGHWVLKHPTKAISNIPSNQRPNLYDNSLRVPTMVRWPGVIKPGTRVEQTVSNLDWFPTLLAIADPDFEKPLPIRGRDITPLLKGGAPADWENDLYAEYSTKHQSQTHMRGIRTAKWKLIRDFKNPARDELYNLEDDPAETTNRIGDSSPAVQKVIAELHAKIVAKMKQNGDGVLEEIGR